MVLALGENHPHFGKKFTEDHRKKMSDAHTGKPKSEQHKLNMRKPKSKDHIEKSALSRTGLVRTPETKKKMSEAAKEYHMRIKNEKSK